MKDILGLVAEVEQKAVTIIDLAKEEKEKLKLEEIVNRQQFEQQKKKEYEAKRDKYKASLDAQAEASIQQLEQQSMENQIMLKDYYESQKAALVSQLRQQVIGE